MHVTAIMLNDAVNAFGGVVVTPGPVGEWKVTLAVDVALH